MGTPRHITKQQERGDPRSPYDTSLTDIDSLESKLDEYKKVTVDSVQAQLRRYESENADLRQTIEKMDKQRRQNKENTIETIQEYQRFEEENHALNQEINELSDHNQQLIESNQTYLNKLTEIQGENESLRASLTKYSDYDDLLREIESFKGLEGINEQIQTELEQAKRTITALQKKVSESSTNDALIVSLREELEMKKASSKGTIDAMNEDGRNECRLH